MSGNLRNWIHMWIFRHSGEDLVAIALFVLMANLVFFTPFLSNTPIRLMFGLVFVLFVPGYATLVALLPASTLLIPSDKQEDGTLDRYRKPLGPPAGLEALLIAIVLSMVIVASIGLALALSGIGVRFTPVAETVSAVTLLAVFVAAIRRNRNQREVPLQPAFFSRMRKQLSTWIIPETKTDLVLNICIGVALILAISGGLYATSAQQNGAITELYFSPQVGGDSERLGVPVTLVRGRTATTPITVANHEGEPTEYILIVQLQRINWVDGSSEVRETEQLARASEQVSPGESWRPRLSFTPWMAGRQLQMSILLYTDEVPTNPTRDNAYRELHTQVNVVYPPEIPNSTISENSNTSNELTRVRRR